MFDFKGVKNKKINDSLNKSARRLAQKTFLAFCLFLLIALSSGAAIVFLCGDWVKKESSTVGEENAFKFDSETHQKIIEIWQERSDSLSKAVKENYPNPFGLTK